MLDPLLFLAFINDLPEAVNHSDSHLFADDCLLYRLVRSDADTKRLQEDLGALEKWEVVGVYSCVFIFIGTMLKYCL